MALMHLSSAGYYANPSRTRPANATAYAISDVVGATDAVWTFTNVGPANAREAGSLGANVVIMSASLRVDVTGVPAGMTSFRLHLYNVTPPSALADNAAWDLPSGDRAGYQGYIDLGTPVDVGSTLYVQTDNGLNKPVVLAAGSSTLYGYLVTNTAFTPTSAAVKTIELHTTSV